MFDRILELHEKLERNRNGGNNNPNYKIHTASVNYANYLGREHLAIQR